MTRAEFDAITIGGYHVPLTCENHPDLRWSCKKIAITFDADGVGRYNHSRHVFFATTDKPECECPADKLKLLLDEEPNNPVDNPHKNTLP